VKIAIVTLIMTQLMNLAFIGPLKHAGLSLSIGLAACLNAGLLYWQLRKQDISRRSRAGRVSCASGDCGAGDVGGAAWHDVCDAGVVPGHHALSSDALMAVVASGWWLTLPRSRCWASK
jgi:hypothetical protein